MCAGRPPPPAQTAPRSRACSRAAALFPRLRRTAAAPRHPPLQAPPTRHCAFCGAPPFSSSIRCSPPPPPPPPPLLLPVRPPPIRACSGTLTASPLGRRCRPRPQSAASSRLSQPSRCCRRHHARRPPRRAAAAVHRRVVRSIAWAARLHAPYYLCAHRPS